MTARAPLTGLQDWYLCACDGEIDGTPGVRLGPCEDGWALHVDLEEAGLQGRDCPEITIRRTADDWLHAWTDDREFRADCGPLTLTEAIKTYLVWAGRLAPAGGSVASRDRRN